MFHTVCFFLSISNSVHFPFVLIIFYLLNTNKNNINYIIDDIKNSLIKEEEDEEKRIEKIKINRIVCVQALELFEHTVTHSNIMTKDFYNINKSIIIIGKQVPTSIDL